MRKIKIVATAAFAKAPPGGSTVMLATQPAALVIGITLRELRCHGIFSAR